jgi:hypothetical protein
MADLLKEILARAEGLDAKASDDDLHLWRGTIEIDRLPSGLTLRDRRPSPRGDSGMPYVGSYIQDGDVF